MNEPSIHRRFFHTARALVALLVCTLAGSSILRAQLTIDVTDLADLQSAITQTNAAAPGTTVTINFSPDTTIIVPGQLVLNTQATVQVVGNGSTLNGNNTTRIMEVDSGTINLQGLTFENGFSQIGAGGSTVNSGGGGGGGGGSAGGAIYLTGGSLTLTNDQFTGNQVVGGAGGSVNGNSGSTFGGGNGSGAFGGAGGARGANGASGGFGSGGGGGGGNSSGPFGNGGNGGIGAGGGGGGASVGGGTGGTGGTGGLLGGNGGTARFSWGGGGGGGAGLGGAVFVTTGATLNLVNTSLNGDSAIGGQGGGSFSPGANGTGLGSGLFLWGGTTGITLTTGSNQTISDTIAELPGSPSAITIGGAGTLDLSGANSYTGGTTITTSTVIVGNSSALGTGNVTNNGTLMVGNGNRLINVGGTFTQTSGTLVLNVNNSGNDQLAITGGGASTFGGTLTINMAGLTPTTSIGHLGTPQTFDVVTTTNGHNGTFTFDPENLAGGATANLSYTINDVVLNVMGGAGLFTITGLNPNQQAVANNINLALGQGTTNTLITSLGDVVTANPLALGGYLDQLTTLNFARFAGSTTINNAGFTTEEMDNYFANHRDAHGNFVASAAGIDYSGLTVNDPNVDSGLQMIYSRLLAWNPAPGAGLVSDVADPVLGGVDMKDSKKMSAKGPEETNPWNFFVSGNVILAQDFSDPSASLSHIDATTGGVQLGVDYTISKNFLVGAMFGYGHTDANLDDIGSTASVDTYSPGVYASYADNGWYANALGSYGFSDYTQDRNVSIGGFSGTAHSSPSGDQIVGNLDGGYDFHHCGWTYGPTLGLQYVHMTVNGYNENGAPDADLTVNRDETDSLRSRLGGRISYAFQNAGLVFTPHLDASWQHEFMDQGRGITDQFDNLGVGSFVVDTANPSRDSALIDLGFDAQVDRQITVFGDYMVQAGQENYFGQSVQAGVKINF